MEKVLSKVFFSLASLAVAIGNFFAGGFDPKTPDRSQGLRQIVVMTPTVTLAPTPTLTPIPTPTKAVSQKPTGPSERALRAASYLYLSLSEGSQKKFRDEYSKGTDNPFEAIKNFVLKLDGNSNALVFWETAIQKDKDFKHRASSIPQDCIVNMVGDIMHIVGCY